MDQVVPHRTGPRRSALRPQLQCHRWKSDAHHWRDLPSDRRLRVSVSSMVLEKLILIPFPCSSPNVYGTHNLVLGENGPKNAMWDTFTPNLTTYEVPKEIVSKVGGRYVQACIGPNADSRTLMSTQRFWRCNCERSIHLG
jgi:hypothetical protein